MGVNDERGTMNAEQPKQRLRFIVHHSSFIVVCLTLLAAILRFMFLDRPAIWGDEAMTFARVCGTWQQLLDELKIAGFAPLHYVLLWSVGRLTTLTPFFMRLIPAVTGTLMVPAMYVLAMQIVTRPTALLVALFTATSSFLLTYSRDAKMYMDFWFFVAMSMACLLWWLRTRSYLGWCLWLLSSIAMVATHALGMAILPVQLVIFLSHRRAHWSRRFSSCLVSL